MNAPTELALAGLDSLSDLSGRLVLWASPEKACLGELLALITLKSGDRLLDIGCGSGELLALAASQEPGAMLVGLDPDEDSLELASHKIPGTIHASELHQGVAEMLPFEDDDFDVVTATRLLVGMEARTRAEVLAECWRVLRPGGRLLVADWMEKPEGLEALVTWPLRLARGILFPGSAGVPTVAEAIAIAGFHAAEPRGRFRTVAGGLEILEAFKPLQR